MTWLHGTLLVTVVEAQGVPPERFFRFPGQGRCKKMLQPLEGGIHRITDLFKRVHAPSEAYVTMELGPARRLRTRAITEPHPIWDETFSVLVADEAADLLFTLKDEAHLGAARLGFVRVAAGPLLDGRPRDLWLRLHDPNHGRPLPRMGMLHLQLQFVAAAQDPNYGGSGLADAIRNGVPAVYFPLRHGNRLTFYHDAHQEPEQSPPVDTAAGPYQSLGAWDDMFEALSAARHLIYITGWSVMPAIKLRRREGVPQSEASENPTLGELLLQKASEGVSVNLLVWDDRTSSTSPLIPREGLMATGDEATREFFAGTAVNCVLAARSGGTDDSAMQQLRTGTLFTHHGKEVIVDAPLGDSGRRHIVGFLGGLDLCEGRYDTAEHSLFRTLRTVHSDDLHQALCKDKVSSAGPREPWHDQHCRVEGPIAHDLLVAFCQRWHKQAAEQLDALVPLARIKDLNFQGFQGPGTGDPAGFITDPEGDRETFCAQLFRSIDSDSTVGLPRSGDRQEAAGLTSGRGKVIDTSVHTAWVTAVRRAQHFLYIENQYFLGSAQAWAANQSQPCHHLVPLEIALKVAAKIRAGQRFAAYIVVPMYSEGYPDSGSVQEILGMQLETMRMMYRVIAEALKTAGSKEHPCDYLNFFTLATREPRPPDEPEPEQPPTSGSYWERMYQNRRLTIYVHSKSCIADDAVILVGSANINQRSMDGSRDTEVVVGAFQPAYLPDFSAGTTPQGQVYGFRKTLWQEHLSTLLPCFDQPASLECVREVRRRARANWEAFMGEEVRPLDSHLVPYPIAVGADGSVEPLGNVPDTDNAPVGGSSRFTLPGVLTS